MNLSGGAAAPAAAEYRAQKYFLQRSHVNVPHFQKQHGRPRSVQMPAFTVADARYAPRAAHDPPALNGTLGGGTLFPDRIPALRRSVGERV